MVLSCIRYSLESSVKSKTKLTFEGSLENYLRLRVAVGSTILLYGRTVERDEESIRITPSRDEERIICIVIRSILNEALPSLSIPHPSFIDMEYTFVDDDSKDSLDITFPLVIKPKVKTKLFCTFPRIQYGIACQFFHSLFSKTASSN